MTDDGLQDVKHALLVSSGKGGVGKSTVAANLAAAFSKQGLSVGLLDADIHGPSQAVMWQLPQNAPIAVSLNPNLSLPFLQHGIKLASLATRMKQDHSVQWRGPMLSMAVINLLCHTDWGQLDVLVVDMPPGTGDVQASICDKLPQAGVISVTTPQQVAVADTRRGMMQYRQHNLKLLGIVENMSTHVCHSCGHVNHVFGFHGAATLSQEFQTPILAHLPLNSAVSMQGDSGLPLVLSDINHTVSQIYMQIASHLWSSIND